MNKPNMHGQPMSPANHNQTQASQTNHTNQTNGAQRPSLPPPQPRVHPRSFIDGMQRIYELMEQLNYETQLMSSKLANARAELFGSSTFNGFGESDQRVTRVAEKFAPRAPINPA